MTIGIYGTGRFGSFWASTLAHHADVFTFNRSDRPVPTGCSRATLAELGRCDAVMLCVAISAVADALDALVPYLAPGTVLMDTCSVKLHPARLMEDSVPEVNPVIATHPMFGPDSAGDGITGLPFVFSPVRVSDEVRDRWERFFTGLGLQVMVMTPDEHDREAAFTQGITHFLGRVLADMDLVPSGIATVGYRKLLEVMEQTCNDPYQLFVDLQRYNPHTGEMRERLKASLGRLMDSLGTAQVDSNRGAS